MERMLDWQPLQLSAGLIFIVIGYLIRFVCVYQMKTFSLGVHDVDKIKTDGMYKYVRHPSYIGSIIMFFGLSLVSMRFCLIYFVFVFFLTRAIQEEMILMKKGEYVEYMNKTGMFFPKLKGNNNG